MATSLAQFDAQRKAGGGVAAATAPQDDALTALLQRADAITNRPDETGKVPTPSPGYTPKAVRDLTDPGQGNYFREHPYTASPSNDPTAAAYGSGLETAGKAAKGVALSPLKALASLPQVPGQILKGYGSLVDLAADPSLLASAPRAAWDEIKNIGQNPEHGGDLIGQLLMGKYAPEIADAGVRGTAALGRGVGKLGDLIEKGGQAAIDTKIAGGMGVPGLGALEAVMGSHPVAGVATAAAPYVAKYAGKGIGAVGDSLASLKRFANDDLWAGDASAAPPVDTAAADLLGGQARAYEGPGQGPKPPIRVTPFADEQNLRTNPQTGETFAGDSPVKSEPSLKLVNIDTRRVPGGAQSFADAVREQAAKPAFKMEAEGAFSGDRANTGFPEGPQGLSAVQEGRVGTNPAFQHFAGDRPSLSGLEGLKQRWGYQEPPTDNSFVMTAPPEGASTGIPGEFPPGPAAPGFDVGPTSTLPESTGSPLADAARLAEQRRFHMKFLKDLRDSAGIP